MKKLILLAACTIIFFQSYCQKQGIGLRLGNPIGLTYKKYFGLKAIELGLCSSSQGWSRAYYENTFESHDDFDDYRYRSHKVQSALYLQARYLLHNEIYVQGMEGKWDWYWGIGGVLKFASIKYRFHDDTPPLEEYETYHDIDLGPEGIAGMEYTFEGVPVTIYGEVSLMLEFVNRLTLQPFGAVGVRYNF
jgi:hypothetical protein